MLVMLLLEGRPLTVGFCGTLAELVLLPLTFYSSVQWSFDLELVVFL